MVRVENIYKFKKSFIFQRKETVFGFLTYLSGGLSYLQNICAWLLGIRA